MNPLFRYYEAMITKEDMKTAAKYMAQAIRYSVTVYRDHDGAWRLMDTGVAENCWPDDIRSMVGVWLYEEDRFLDADRIDRWSEEDLSHVTGMLSPEKAKAAFESRSTVGSRFVWSEAQN